jgi:LmbE family N-acetylglucosaminyl deacetylase
MNWIYLSPHLDDVVLSCGGLVWEQVQQGNRVEIWTICAGDPPSIPLSNFALSLHERWQTEQKTPAHRRAEDLVACRRLGVTPRYFSMLDCIYRRSPENGESLYNNELDLFGEINPAEIKLVSSLTKELAQAIPRGSNLVSPLTVGGHVDHRLVRAAVEGLKSPVWFYADYPYIQWLGAIPGDLVNGMRLDKFPVTNSGLVAWVEAVAAYTSQISSFWFTEEDMEREIRNYCQKNDGVRLWRHAE